MPGSKRRLVGSLDVGGTKIAVAVVTAQGRVVAESTQPTPTAKGPDAVVTAMARAMRSLCRKSGLPLESLAAVGVSSAGLVDLGRGVVRRSPNLLGWVDVPLVEALSQQLSRPVYIGNDANLAALAEHRLGAGQGAHDMLYVTLSTGIGGGIIIGDRLYTGRWGFAGEVGHLVVEVGGPLCGCGNRGCLEAIASGSAIARAAQEQLRQGVSSALASVHRGDVALITAAHVFEAARLGDALACQVVERATRALGAGLTGLVNAFDPERIIIGGGMSAQWDTFVAPAAERMRQGSYVAAAGGVTVVPAALGQRSSLLGAALLALDASRKK